MNGAKALTVHDIQAGQIRISARVRAFLQAVSEGVKVPLAAKVAGISPRHARRVMADPKIRALLHTMARDKLALAQGMAASRVIAMAEQDDSKKVALDAAVHILGIGNIRPAQGPATQVNVNVSSGFVLTELSSPQDRAAAKVAMTAPGTGGGYVIDLTAAETIDPVSPDT